MESGERLLGWQCKKDSGKGVCGVVIKGVDKDRWVTISRIAVPLKAGTAMAAEVTGVWAAHGNP